MIPVWFDLLFRYKHIMHARQNVKTIRRMTASKSIVLICWLLSDVTNFASSYKNPHFAKDRNTIVHLFEWKWSDISDECENFLQHKGYGGVQISPPHENLIVLRDGKRPWWERYQPVSYKLVTRSGGENAFKDMTRRCNAVGVRIYADVALNHMSAGSGTGTGGSVANATHESYPAVPYGEDDFHAGCAIDWNDTSKIRNCGLVGLKDLNQGKEYVRGKIVEFLNHLVDLGVAGFRIDAARHMWPGDLEVILSRVKDLKEDVFGKKARPFVYQEVSDMNREYLKIGTLVEFKYSRSISNVFKGNDKLVWLSNWGPGWGLIDGLDAVAFVDNHDNQREEASLNYKRAKQYKMAVAFMLAHPYGTTRVMSSFDFSDFNQGPPEDKNGGIISPGINSDGTCSNGWICEHRWRQIFNMVEFRNVVSNTGVNDWWSNADQQISFCRGGKGFVAFTNWGDISQDLQTCLPAGEYCDVISGGLVDGNCTGKSINVGADGKGHVKLGALEFDGVFAIHLKSRKP